MIAILVLAAQGIDWQGEWVVAVEEATARNVPILYAVHKDGWQPCTFMAESTYRDARVVELSKSFVNVVGMTDTAHGEEKKLCKLFQTIPCSVHQRGMYAGKNFFSGNAKPPTLVFCDPKGKELFRHEGKLDAAGLAKKMNEALGKLAGARILLPQWKQLQDAAKARESGEIKKAIELYTKLAKTKATKEAAAAGLAKVGEIGDARLEEASKLPADERRAALQAIVEEFKPLAVSTRAQKALDALK